MAESEKIKKVAKIAAHAHVTGIDPSGDYCTDGLVAQIKTKRALDVIIRMVKQQNASGRMVLITGEAETGKSALVYGFAKSLAGYPVNLTNAAMINSRQINIGEALLQEARKAIAFVLEEEVTVIEGELVSAVPRDDGGDVVLRTTDMESLYHVGNRFFEIVEREHILPGDIISVSKETGHVTRIGVANTSQNERQYFFPCVNYLESPKGELLKQKEERFEMTLHDIDILNMKNISNVGCEETEVPINIRDTVKKNINSMFDTGKGKITSGVLIIEDVHLLNKHGFSFLGKIMEMEFAPLIVLTTCTDIPSLATLSGLGMAGNDVLDRMLVCETHKYTHKEVSDIFAARTADYTEKDSELIAYCTRIAMQKGLRYAVNILSISYVFYQKKKNKVSLLKELQEVSSVLLSKCDLSSSVSDGTV